MRLHIISIVFRKELREMLRDRRSLAIMFGIPLVLYPALTILISQVGLSKQKELTEHPAKVAVENPQAAPHLIELMSRPESSVKITLTADAKADLALGKIDAVLILPPNGESAALAARPVEFVTRLDRSRTNSMAAESKINKVLEKYQQWVIEQRLSAHGQSVELLQPLKRKVQDVATADQRFGKLFGLALPVLLLMTGMLGALFPALNATTTERELGTLETLLVSPAGRMELLIAKGSLVLVSALLTAALNMFSMSLVLWRVLSSESALANFQISTSGLIMSYLAAVPTLITFATLVLIVGLLARNFREANSLATPIMMIPLASMLVGMLEPKMSPGLLVTPVANTTIIIREVLTGRMTAGPFVLAFISSCVYAGLILSAAAKVFTNEQLVNPAWEPVSLKGFRPSRTRREPWRLPGIDEALGLFAITLLLIFYIAPSLTRFGFIGMLTIQQIGLIAAPALLLAWLGKYRFRETFSWRRASPVALIAAAMLGVGLAPWMQVVGAIQSKIWHPNLEQQMELLKRILPLLERLPILLPLLIGLLAGACEEILFRGPIQNGLLRKLSMWPAILIASLMFAAAHLDLFGLPVRMFLGVILGWMAVRTGSIFPAMVMHASYDIAQLLSISREVYAQGTVKVLDQVTTSQGSELSIQFLVVGTILTVAAMIMLRRASAEPRGFPVVTTPPTEAYSMTPPTN